MKKILLAAFFACTIFAFGCKEESTGNMAQIAALRDTVLHSFVEVTGVVIEVKDDHQLNVVMVGPKLPSKPDADKQQLTDHVADMAWGIFKGKDLEKGRVVFSPTDVTDMDAAMAGKTFDMHLEGKPKSN